MLKTTDRRELSRTEGSMREKLRAKIRQKIQHMPNEGDENVNTLNQDKPIGKQRESDKTVHPRVERVSFSHDSFSTLYSFFNKTYLTRKNL